MKDKSKVGRQYPYLIDVFAGLDVKYMSEHGCKVTLDKLGAAIGAGYSTVGHWRCGDAKPKALYVSRLADFYNVDLDELINAVNGKPYNLNADYFGVDTGIVRDGEELQRLIDESKAKSTKEVTKVSKVNDISITFDNLLNEEEHKLVDSISKYTHRSKVEVLVSLIKKGIDELDEEFVSKCEKVDVKKDLMFR